LKDRLTVGDYLAITMVANSIFANFNSFSQLVIHDVINNLPQYRRVDHFISQENEKPENSISKINKIEISEIKFTHLNSEFEIRSKVFDLYRDGIYYLVGKNGSGKSTFLDVLTGLYKLEYGSIKFNDVHINLISEEWKRNNIAIVMQEPLILSGTIFDNIIFDTKVGRSTIRERATVSGLLPFYEVLEDRFDEVLENENSLSGGEKQMIQALRLIVNDPSLILIDEGDSNLDSRFKKVFRDALLKMCYDKLIIVITHDLTQINPNDSIILINNGEVSPTNSTYEELKKYMTDNSDREIS